jgi:O-antigen/teichoic acid export membrane protein
MNQQNKERDEMKNVYKSIVLSVVFGNIIAFPVIAYTFPWETYLIDPSTYYIVQSGSLGFLIAACIFFYEWVKYGEHRIFQKIKAKIATGPKLKKK